MNFLSKYPRTRHAMNETGMDLDQLYILTEILAGSEQPDKELKKLKESGG